MGTRRLSTILAVDAVGYSAMLGRGSDAALSALNTVFRRVVRPQAKAFEGRIAKLMGDGAIIEFGSARGAILCAAAIQREIRADPP